MCGRVMMMTTSTYRPATRRGTEGVSGYQLGHACQRGAGEIRECTAEYNFVNPPDLMQTRRQDCRISSRPLVIFVPKYGFRIACRSAHRESKDVRGAPGRCRPGSRVSSVLNRVEVGTAGRQKLAPRSRRPISSLFRRVYHQSSRHGRNSTSFPVKEPYLWKNPSPSSVQAEHDGLGVRSRVR